MESRLLCGSEPLFERFLRRFRRQVSGAGQPDGDDRRPRGKQERARYGETVFLLGAERQALAAAACASCSCSAGSAGSATARPTPPACTNWACWARRTSRRIQRAGEFLLWLRNELHFHAGQAADVLTRFEQVRIADALGYQPVAGLLPVEQFMREYFRHTSQVSHVVERFVAKATRAEWRRPAVHGRCSGHRVEAGLRVGPGGDHRHPPRDCRSSAATWRRSSAWPTWRTFTTRRSRRPPGNSSAARPRNSAASRRRRPAAGFLALLSHPGRLGTVLRDLHGAAILERFIPEFARARGLLQFNQYHKYTVDEHCLRAVEFAAAWPATRGRWDASIAASPPSTCCTWRC